MPEEALSAAAAAAAAAAALRVPSPRALFLRVAGRARERAGRGKQQRRARSGSMQIGEKRGEKEDFGRKSDCLSKFFFHFSFLRKKNDRVFRLVPQLPGRLAACPAE